MTGDEMPDTEQTAQPGQLSIEATATDGIRLLTLAGEIDNDTGGTLRQALDVTTQQPRLVLDLRQVTFMDSTGINILIAVHRTVTAADGWLRLAAPTDSVMRTLQIVGVDTLIDCYPTVRHALSY
ncbi:STAS domain-containing protein [Streptomyces pseudovenezuelae]|uniref:Anti-sigma factor antagonist n=1 Tax=Streptomyces pseudovenezuelae TaxID=67350 RepID=A0ABZ1XBK2_9ACTN|nr:STAS domain-containing protein [Streptomyces pseudovenezuelae]